VPLTSGIAVVLIALLAADGETLLDYTGATGGGFAVAFVLLPVIHGWHQ
jgi:hypothetical protein